MDKVIHKRLWISRQQPRGGPTRAGLSIQLREIATVTKIDQRCSGAVVLDRGARSGNGDDPRRREPGAIGSLNPCGERRPRWREPGDEDRGGWPPGEPGGHRSSQTWGGRVPKNVERLLLVRDDGPQMGVLLVVHGPADAESVLQILVAFRDRRPAGAAMPDRSGHSFTSSRHSMYLHPTGVTTHFHRDSCHIDNGPTCDRRHRTDVRPDM